MQDFQITESTKYRYIGIYSLMVKVSRFPLAGLSERKANTYFGKPIRRDNQQQQDINNQTIRNSQQIATPHGFAALKTIYFDLSNGDDFITLRIEQVLDEAKQVSIDNNTGQGKQIVVEHKQTKQQINFIDAMNYTQPRDLASFAMDFGNQDKVGTVSARGQSKGLFPHESITYDNYNQELIKSQHFQIKTFDSKLKNKTISDEDYLIYRNDAKNYATKLDNLQHYNELGTQIMIQQLDNLNNWFYQHTADIFSFMSLASNVNVIKHAIAYKDFDLSINYPSTQSKSNLFIQSQSYWNSKVIGYNIQDKQKHRKTNNNVTINDYDYFKDLSERQSCVICGDKFTMDNKSTLDRIDNRLPHIKSNCQLCCLYCNRYKSDKDEKVTKLFIQLCRYCNINHLPQTIIIFEVYQLMRRNITGGLSNVMHHEKNATYILACFCKAKCADVPS
ncbi:MAG: hypothetical protein EZS28_022777 [Streblomastix strix]|uniref:Uncharacterized protein n=1 Tax=Streblomastix strix TaxID=222440 RepID=A0A5J4VH97_9EUKA|nr:MAG: hypothetical protein EZS28_022777 [Streblomastix strix]